MTFLLLSPLQAGDDTWSNWSRHLEEDFAEISIIKMPGRTMGVVVPASDRQDILQMSAIAYQSLANTNFSTLVILLPAPASYNLDGLAIPGRDSLETPVGVFNIDHQIREVLRDAAHNVHVDPDLFRDGLPRIFTAQLALLRSLRKKSAGNIQILPIYVKFSNANDQVKDLAPFVVNQLKDLGAEEDVAICVVSNLGKDLNQDSLVKADAVRLNAIRALNIDPLLEQSNSRYEADSDAHQNIDTLLLGLLTLRLLGGDHAQILAAASAHQLLLTKDKNKQQSFFAAGVSSRPPIEAKVPHIKQEKMIETFDELIRGDLLNLARQTLLSTLDSAAARPPSLDHKTTGQPWPVYVSILDPEGNMVGRAGTHLPSGPLEESIHKFIFEATQQAKSLGLTKSNASSYVVEISIPHGFDRVSEPDGLIPLLNGVVVSHNLKSAAHHPEAWRRYPDPHQLLADLSVQLGLKPWAYATSQAWVESFRVFSFNEKEPFQDLGATARKKKKKKGGDNEDLFEGDTGVSDGGGGSGSPFGF